MRAGGVWLDLIEWTWDSIEAEVLVGQGTDFVQSLIGKHQYWPSKKYCYFGMQIFVAVQLE